MLCVAMIGMEGGREPIILKNSDHNMDIYRGMDVMR